jgi:hypothetical protein
VPLAEESIGPGGRIVTSTQPRPQEV